MINTTEDAREYFKPLTMEDVTENNFIRLCGILEKYLGQYNNNVLEYRTSHVHGDNRYHMALYHNKHKGTIYVTDNRRKSPFKGAYIKVLCDNYAVREGISFNKDGFIGFAGWSDSTNVRPFLDAFEEWVDILKLEKYGVTPVVTGVSYISQEDIEKHHKAMYDLLEKGIPMEQSLFNTDITIYKKDLDYWTPEQYNKIKEIKNIDQTQGIKITSTLNKEQRETFINSYFVDEFPEDPELGRLIYKDGKEYVFTGEWVSITQDDDVIINQVKQLVNSLGNESLKNKILQVIG